MKPLLLLVVLTAALFTGCQTKLDCAAGTYSTMGDNTDATIKAKDGKITYYHAGSNVHTPVTKANWHGVVTLGAEAAGVAAGGAIPGGQMVVPAVAAFVNRPTSRVTPTPTPIPVR